MYLFSISDQDGTDLPEISLTIDGEAFVLEKSMMNAISLGYLHMSDRWDFYPPLYDDYFCDAFVAERLGFALADGKFLLNISFTKNNRILVKHSQKIECD